MDPLEMKMEKKKQIPRILHQMWLDYSHPSMARSPEKYLLKGYPQSFQSKNPDWKYEFWNLEKVEKLFLEPPLSQFKEYFADLNPIIKKCDFARHAVLWKQGGLYYDLDFICYRNLDTLIAGRELLFTKEHCLVFNDKHKPICNGCMGGAPNHEIFLFIMKSIQNYFPQCKTLPLLARSSAAFASWHIVKHTGPYGLTRYIRNYRRKVVMDDQTLFVSCGYIFENSAALTWFRIFTRSPFRLIKFCDRNLLYTNTMWNEGTDWGFEFKDEIVAENQLM